MPYALRLTALLIPGALAVPDDYQATREELVSQINTSPERARSLKQPPAWLLGGAMATEHRSAGYRDYTRIAAHQSGPRAFANARCWRIFACR